MDTTRSIIFRTQASPLLKLAPELRSRIWTLAVVEEDMILTKHCESKGGHSRLPGIIQVSRQTRKEALPIYLGQNTFEFELLRTKNKDDKFAVRSFGPLCDHLASMHRLQFKRRMSGSPIHRMVREGDWSTVHVDYIRGGEVVEGEEAADKLTQRLLRLMKEAMGRNADRQLRQKDLVSLAKLMARGM